jgi:tRNA (uracil-5-)-methyltransferase TRM9
MAASDAYEVYYGSTLYDRRYPRPNRRTVDLVQRWAPAGSSIIDIGAGNGRYALPLASMGYRVIAVEPSEGGREQMSRRAREQNRSELVDVHAALSEVSTASLAESTTAMFLFGVLGHMNFEERSDVLRGLSASMSPRARLVGSVPNRHRRFRREQNASRVPDRGTAPRVRYCRRAGADEIALEVTAFSPAELTAELADCGWCCEVPAAESLLPEAAVTSRPRLGYLDAYLCERLPAATGYCLFYHASTKVEAQLRSINDAGVLCTEPSPPVNPVHQYWLVNLGDTEGAVPARRVSGIARTPLQWLDPRDSVPAGIDHQIAGSPVSRLVIEVMGEVVRGGTQHHQPEGNAGAYAESHGPVTIRGPGYLRSGAPPQIEGGQSGGLDQMTQDVNGHGAEPKDETGLMKEQQPSADRVGGEHQRHP